MEVQIFEIVVGAVVVLCALSGYRKGLVRTIYSMVSFVITIVLSILLSKVVITFIPDSFGYQKQISYIVAFILAGIVVGIVDRALGVVNMLPLVKQVNKLAGLMAGILQGLVVIWFVFFLLHMFRNLDFCQTLLSYVKVSPFLQWIDSYNPTTYCINYVLKMF